MVGNSFVYSQFQKRRRRSNPTSPTSPSFSRISFEKSDGFLHVSSPADSISASTFNSESPVIEVDMPSPTLDISTPSAPQRYIQSAGNSRPARSSDDYGQHKRPVLADPARPSSSAASAPTLSKPGSFPNPNSSPLIPPASNFVQPSFEHLGHGYFNQEQRNRFHDEQGSSPRTFSSPSISSERSIIDESGSGRNFAGRKSRLNLLNPINLLQRRRSSQVGKPGDVNVSIGALGVPALPDGDPSIRGNRIIDFSARRPRRIYSHNDASSDENSPLAEPRPNFQDYRRVSDLSIPPSSQVYRNSQSPQRAPVFKEHFNEDRPTLQPGNTGYLHTFNASQSLRVDPIPINLPAFARKLPARVPDGHESRRKSVGRHESVESSDVSSQPLDHERKTIEAFRSSPPPPTPPPKSPPSPKLSLPPLSNLPKHMTSTSSRFSFQLGHSSSTQEKYLEEKHKQQQAAKKLADIDGEDDLDDPYYSDPDFNDDDLEEKIPGINADADDEDFEEPIPGINADADDEDFEEPIPGINADAYDEDFEEPIPGVNADSDIDGNGWPSVNGHKYLVTGQQLQGYDDFHFTPQTATFSPNHTLETTQPTPLDEKGRKIGTAHGELSTDLSTPEESKNGTRDSIKTSVPTGLGIMSTQMSSPLVNGLHSPEKNSSSMTFDDEDIYFDDGQFDETSEDQNEVFDEKIFDNETEKIPDIPARNARRLEAVKFGDSDKVWIPPLDNKPVNLKKEGISGAVGSREDFDEHSHYSSSADNDSSLMDTRVMTSDNTLTEGNLAAYHDALASAANEAAAQGRFSRNVSFTPVSEDQGSQSLVESSPQGIDSSSSRISYNFGTPGLVDEDGFLYDEFDDDQMIAEANAEVLENDDEEFYGDEFGFYARAPGKESSDLTNGGYFGARSSGVKRSHSAKANFQEPTLTPITERSEWSARNSVVEFKTAPFPISAHSLPSPGLASYADFEPKSLEEELAMLRILKRGAFGGSSNSINSLVGSYTGSSPLAQISGFSLGATDGGHRMSSSLHSLAGSVGIPESEEEDDGQHELPTLTQCTPRKQVSDPSPITPQSYATLSPSLGPSDKSRFFHSRTSSGAESVSYERGPDGRWLQERRRTGDDGELEIIGREYLAGARI